MSSEFPLVLVEVNKLVYAFLQNYHQDCANAAIHTSEVRFSPLTFRLAEMLRPQIRNMVTTHANAIMTVMEARGKYPEDMGRIAEDAKLEKGNA